MAKMKNIQVSALNIAMQTPHSAERYIELFEVVRRQRVLVKVDSLRAAMVGPISNHDDSQEYGPIYGEIYYFIKISRDEPWFNLITRAPASLSDASSIELPTHLLPHLKIIPFVFGPTNHRLYFSSKISNASLSTQRAKKIFEEIINSACREGNFPQVNITIIPDQETLENIFNIHRLRTLEITLSPPNPDDSEDDQVRLLRKLDLMHAKKETRTFHAKYGESLSPDEETRTMALVAAENGKVVGEGIDENGAKVKESTEGHPWMKNLRYDPDRQTAFGAMIASFFG
ncbi:DUF4747 family protein [Sphaerotilus sp.]|jgi:Domain of unknown function (DUF4747)|uniref:DUF4747 family protein n=1 Tax=Sphaerotilus sp. TaxID=2093942 RepID=UPI0025EB32F3|nr:DUF4747 family protein [Sphaerotilus sp.]